MRAAVLHAPHDLRVEDRPDPSAGDGDVMIEVALQRPLRHRRHGVHQGSDDGAARRCRHPGSGHVGPDRSWGTSSSAPSWTTAAGTRQWAGRRVASGAGVSCGECALVPPRPHQPLRPLLHPRAEHARRAGRARRVPAATLRRDPRRLHRPRRGSRAAAGGRAARRTPVGGAAGRHVVAARRGGDRVVHPGRPRRSRRPRRRARHRRRAAGDGPRRSARPRPTSSTPTPSPDDLRDLVPDGAEVVIESSGVPGRRCPRARAGGPRRDRSCWSGSPRRRRRSSSADVVLREIDVRTTVAHVCDTDLPAALELLAAAAAGARAGRPRRRLEDVVQAGFEPLAAGSVARQGPRGAAPWLRSPSSAPAGWARRWPAGSPARDTG